MAAGASLEFARILVIASEQSRGSNLGILKFPSFLLSLLQSLEGSKILEFPKSCVIPRLDRGISTLGILEFLRINLEFLEIASLRSQ